MTDTSPKRPGLFQRLTGLHPVLVLLAADDARAAGHDGEGLGRMWLTLGFSGFLWGLVLTVAWSLAAAIFPISFYSPLPLMPALAVLAAMTLGPFRRGLQALADELDGDRPAAQSVMSALLIVAITLCLLSLLPKKEDWPHWPPLLLQWLGWLRPPVENRVLLLMPMWGAWAMMVPCHFCRPAEGACRLVTAFARRQPVAATALWMAAPLALTLWYLDSFGPFVALPAGAGLLAGSLGGIAICLRRGGLSRHALLAANLAAQLAFLLGYLAGKGLNRWA